MRSIKHERDMRVNPFVFGLSAAITGVNTLPERMVEARSRQGWSQTELARRAGVAQSTIGNIEAGTRQAKGSLPQIAEALDVTLRWLRDGEGHPESSNVRPAESRGQLPLISWVQAGQWTGAQDHLQPGEAERWLECPASHSERSYALRVRGDSMTAAYGRTYPEGCIIFVDPAQKSPNNGARIIAKLDGSDEVTFKVFKQEDGRTWLQPLNASHRPIYEEFKVLGTVIGKWEDE